MTETAATYNVEKAARLGVAHEALMHNTLNKMCIPPGPLFSRLAKLLEHDTTRRNMLHDAMVARMQAVEKLQAIMRADYARMQDNVSPIADVITRYHVHHHAELQAIIDDLQNLEPNYLEIEPVKELVMGAQMLMCATDDILEQMRDAFVPGDPLLKALNNARGETELALTAIRSRSGVKGV